MKSWVQTLVQQKQKEKPLVDANYPNLAIIKDQQKYFIVMYSLKACRWGECSMTGETAGNYAFLFVSDSILDTYVQWHLPQVLGKEDWGGEGKRGESSHRSQATSPASASYTQWMRKAELNIMMSTALYVK
jgi:hypothetical protein